MLPHDEHDQCHVTTRDMESGFLIELTLTENEMGSMKLYRPKRKIGTVE
jgi:hypothetical protein